MPLFNANIDLDKNQLQNAVVHSGSSKPGSPATGQIFYDTDSNQIQVYTGSDWEGLVTETKDATTITDVTSVLNAALVIGRDADNDIDFGTDNNIIFRAAAADQIVLKDGVLEPVTDDDVDLGSASKQFKNGFFDGTLETDVLAINGTNVTSTAAELNILDGVTSTAAELNVLDGITAVVGELNALDIGSTAVGTAVASKAVILDSNKDYTGIRNLTITGNLSVTGTTTQVDTVTMRAENAVVFEGATADDHETTLTIVDPTADHTYKLPDLGSTNDEGFIAAFAANPGTSPLITSTPTELNLLDGVTSTTAELNILDGVTSTAAELNILDGVTSTAAELNILDGVTSTAAELNILDGVTSTAAELNILDGVTATAAEINLIDGGTSRGTTAVADGDGLLVNDGGTMRMTSVQTVRSYMLSSLTSVGALDEGSITSGFGAIDNGTSGIRTATFTAETAFVPDASDGATLGSASLEFSDLYLADGAQILFGDDQEIAITHVADVGLTFSHETSGSDNKPFILTLESEEDDIVNGDIIAGIEFKAGDSGGSDAILPTVGIFAVATDTFAATKNQSKLVFRVAQTETAGNTTGTFDGGTDDMTLDHGGNLTIPGELDAATGDFSGAVDIAGDLTLSAGGDGALVFGTAGQNSIKIPDNQASALIIEQADNAYMTFKTSNSNELVTVNKAFNVGSTFSLGGTAVTSTAAELNILDGVTSTAAELNILDGVTSTAAELNILDGVTSTAAELNILDGVTSTAAELNILDGVTSTAAELNILDGVTATAAEINLIDGGTARGTTAVADGDGILTNDGGTMRMTKVETFATYFAAECAALREKTFVLNNSTSGVASSDNITYTVTHSLNSRNVMVEVIRNGENSGDYQTVYTDVKRNGDDTITVVFGSARTAGDYTVMIRKIG